MKSPLCVRNFLREVLQRNASFIFYINSSFGTFLLIRALNICATVFMDYSMAVLVKGSLGSAIRFMFVGATTLTFYRRPFSGSGIGFRPD